LATGADFEEVPRRQLFGQVCESVLELIVILRRGKNASGVAQLKPEFESIDAATAAGTNAAEIETGGQTSGDFHRAGGNRDGNIPLQDEVAERAIVEEERIQQIRVAVMDRIEGVEGITAEVDAADGDLKVSAIGEKNYILFAPDVAVSACVAFYLGEFGHKFQTK
jgi:hypothetical protein